MFALYVIVLKSNVSTEVFKMSEKKIEKNNSGNIRQVNINSLNESVIIDEKMTKKLGYKRKHDMVRSIEEIVKCDKLNFKIIKTKFIENGNSKKRVELKFQEPKSGIRSIKIVEII